MDQAEPEDQDILGNNRKRGDVTNMGSDDCIPALESDTTASQGYYFCSSAIDIYQYTYTRESTAITSVARLSKNKDQNKTTTKTSNK